jgi:hypothetical protein
VLVSGRNGQQKRWVFRRKQRGWKRSIIMQDSENLIPNADDTLPVLLGRTPSKSDQAIPWGKSKKQRQREARKRRQDANRNSNAYDAPDSSANSSTSVKASTNASTNVNIKDKSVLKQSASGGECMKSDEGSDDDTDDIAREQLAELHLTAEEMQ